MAFKTAADVGVIATETRELIDDYMLCNESTENRTEFLSLSNNFSAILLSKPLNLTFFGIKSISYTTLGFIIAFIGMNSNQILNLIQQIRNEQQFPTHNSSSQSHDKFNLSLEDESPLEDPFFID